MNSDPPSFSTPFYHSDDDHSEDDNSEDETTSFSEAEYQSKFQELTVLFRSKGGAKLFQDTVAMMQQGRLPSLSQQQPQQDSTSTPLPLSTPQQSQNTQQPPQQEQQQQQHQQQQPQPQQQQLQKQQKLIQQLQQQLQIQQIQQLQQQQQLQQLQQQQLTNIQQQQFKQSQQSPQQMQQSPIDLKLARDALANEPTVAFNEKSRLHHIFSIINVYMPSDGIKIKLLKSKIDPSIVPMLSPDTTCNWDSFCDEVLQLYNLPTDVEKQLMTVTQIPGESILEYNKRLQMVFTAGEKKTVRFLQGLTDISMKRKILRKKLTEYEDMIAECLDLEREKDLGLGPTSSTSSSISAISSNAPAQHTFTQSSQQHNDQRKPDQKKRYKYAAKYVDGKRYFECPFHARLVRHHPDQCELGKALQAARTVAAIQAATMATAPVTSATSNVATATAPPMPQATTIASAPANTGPLN